MYNKYTWKIYWNNAYRNMNNKKNKYYFIKHCNNKKEFNLKTKSSTISLHIRKIIYATKF